MGQATRNREATVSFLGSDGLRLALLLWGLLMSSLEAQAAGNTYYVATDGNDANSGTSASPFKTIQKAANIVNPGDTVIVRNGVYQIFSSDPYSILVRLTRSGSSGNDITFKSESKWGAILDGRGTTYRGFDFSLIGYVRIEDFEIRNMVGEGIKFSYPAHHIVIKGNRIHHSQGMGILGSPDTTEIDSNYLHDNGDAWFGTEPNVNRDHGIYSAGTNMTVKNNIFARHQYGWAIQISGGSNWKIYNNTFAFPNPVRNGHIILWKDYTTVDIDNNIFYKPTKYGVQKSYDGGTVVIRNNMTTEGSISGGATGGVTASNNFTSTDPKPANPSADDFRLQQGSPAVDKGIPLTEVTADHDGIVRPQGPAYDIGAYEYAMVNPTVRGDLNGSGTVDLADVRLLIEMIVGQMPPDLATADLDADGKLTLADVRGLINILISP